MTRSTNQRITHPGVAMHQVVRTEDLPPADRFAFWQEMLAKVAMPVTARSSYSATFLTTVQTAFGQSLRISQFRRSRRSRSARP
jgi:hypothetical protein